MYCAIPMFHYPKILGRKYLIVELQWNELLQFDIYRVALNQNLKEFFEC